MEPLRAVKNFIPVEVTGPALGDCRVCTVIDDLARPLIGTCFEEIDADPVARAANTADIDAEAADLSNAGLGDIVVRERRHELGVKAVVGECYRDVGFAAAECRFE